MHLHLVHYEIFGVKLLNIYVCAIMHIRWQLFDDSKQNRNFRTVIFVYIFPGHLHSVLVYCGNWIRINMNNQQIIGFYLFTLNRCEPRYEKTCLFDRVRHKPACAANKLVKGLKFRIQNLEILYYLSSEQQRHWLDCADAHADLRLCCSHRANTGFLMTSRILHSNVKTASNLSMHEIFSESD